MEQLKKSNLLVRQSFSRQMASGSNDNVYSKFARLDHENTPDVCRCYSAIKDIRSRYRKIGLSDYQYVTEEHMRIIIEHNPSAADLPIIYIRDKFGEKTEFSGYEPELSRLLCMNICMTDEKYKDPGTYRILQGVSDPCKANPARSSAFEIYKDFIYLRSFFLRSC